MCFQFPIIIIKVYFFLCVLWYLTEYLYFENIHCPANYDHELCTDLNNEVVNRNGVKSFVFREGLREELLLLHLKKS